MWSRLICVAAISFGLVPQTGAGERSGLVHRASCTVVRFYVAKYSASAAEAWARSHGATDAEIEAPALSQGRARPNRAGGGVVGAVSSAWVCNARTSNRQFR
jgi:hypothetical protein